MTFFSEKKYYFFVFLIIAIGSLIRLDSFYSNGYWSDEWHTLFFSNPEYSFSELKYNLANNSLHHYENTPYLFYFFLKTIFSIFGYVAEIGRLFILIFACSTIYLCFKIIKLFTKNKYIILLFLFLVSLNPFLIWESQELRVQSLVLFFSLWNFIQFNKLLDIVNFRTSFSFILSMVLVMSFSPAAITIFVSYLIYILFEFNKKSFKYLKILFFSVAIYIFLNIDYLLNVISKKQFEPITLKFFFSYFFNSFFGNYIVGGFFLLILSALTIINFKKNIQDKNLFLVYVIVITTYSLLIIKSVNSNLLVPRYIIFLVPFILILFVKNIENINFIKDKLLINYFISLILILSLINIISIRDRPIKKPQTNELIKYINNSSSKLVTTKEFLFGNYLRTHYLFQKNNLKYVNYNEINNNNSDIWLVCKENMRSEIPKDKLVDHRYIKCVSNDLEKKMKASITINIPDLQATLYVY